MTKPNVKIRFCEGCDEDPPDMGHLVVEINGVLVDSILTDQETGNDSRIHFGLYDIVQQAYTMGHKAGTREAKKKVSDLLDWSRTKD